MNQSNTKQSGLRPLTQEEVNAVSGGFAWVPWIAGIIIKVAITSLIHHVNHDDKNKNNNNNDACHDSGKRS